MINSSLFFTVSREPHKLIFLPCESSTFSEHFCQQQTLSEISILQIPGSLSSKSYPSDFKMSPLNKKEEAKRSPPMTLHAQLFFLFLSLLLCDRVPMACPNLQLPHAPSFLTPGWLSSENPSAVQELSHVLKRPYAPQAALYPHVSLLPEATTAVNMSLLLDSEIQFWFPVLSLFHVVAGTFCSAWLCRVIGAWGFCFGPFSLCFILSVITLVSLRALKIVYMCEELWFWSITRST